MSIRRAEDILEDEAEVLRRAVRRALVELDLDVLRTLMRVIRYAEEGKTPIVVAAEDLREHYKLEAFVRSLPPQIRDGVMSCLLGGTR